MHPSEFGDSSRRTHEILRESEERFRLLVEGVKDYAIFMLDVEGRVTTWNLGAERIKGYESEEIIGEHFSAFYTDEDVERGYPEEVLGLAAADGQYEEEGIRVRKDGSTFWANVVITALRDEAGNLRGFAKVTRDVTLRKEAEERERLLVREQAARERTTDILESISDAFYAVDEEWHFTYVNGKAEDFWGRSREELLGKSMWEEFPQAVGSESYRQILRAMEEGVTTEFESISPVFGAWVAGRAYPSRGGLSVYFHDVTERKRAEEEIRQSEERYRSFVRQSTEGIWRFELEEGLPTDLPEKEQISHFYRHAYLAECNDVLARMYGFTRAEEIVGERLGTFLSRSVPANVEYLRAFVRSGYRLTDAESEEVDREGKTKHFLNNLTGIVKNGLLMRAWGTQRDVTEQRRAEEAQRFLGRASTPRRRVGDRERSGAGRERAVAGPSVTGGLAMTGEVGTMRIRVMHVEDHPDFRDLIQILLRSQSDIELVAQAGSLVEARAHTARLEFDVAVLDLGLPDGNGVDLIPDLRQANPDVGVLILSANLDPGGSERAATGADEILDKLAPLDEVLTTVRRLGNA